MIRVLQVVDTLGMGGAEIWLMELLRLWSRTKAVQMDFLLTSGNVGLFDKEARDLGAQLYYLRYGQSVLSEFSRGLNRVLREQRYNAIHDHQGYASGWHFLLAYRALPHIRVAHVHSPWIHIRSNLAINLRRKYSLVAGRQLARMLATHICGTSEQVLCQHGFDTGIFSTVNVSVLHCGIDIDKFNSGHVDRRAVRQEFNWGPDTKIVLFVGRLDCALKLDHPLNNKNSWLAINIVKAVFEKDQRVCLLMVGEGDQPRTQIEHHILQWGLSDKVRILGVRRDVPRLMRAADVLLFPSREEGLGMVAVEAQAAGLPVLASDRVPRECLVVPELYVALSLEESIERWATVLLETIEKTRPSLSLCRHALKMSAFSIEESAKRLEKIYGSAFTCAGR